MPWRNSATDLEQVRLTVLLLMLALTLTVMPASVAESARRQHLSDWPKAGDALDIALAYLRAIPASTGSPAATCATSS